MKKKKFFMLILALIAGITVTNAQMRIGGSEAPNKSAVLDLNPDNDTISGNATLGLALPRINLRNSGDAFPLSSHVKGMIVYNMATAGDLTSGVYINDGTKWLRQIDGDIFNTSLADNIINYITQNFNGTKLGDSITNYFIQNFETLAFGDTILQYITNNLDRYDLIDKIVELINDNNSYVKNLIKNISQNVYNTVLGDSIITYISDHVTDTLLGDTILRYIADNILNTVLGDNLINLVHENELDGIVGNEVADATKEGGLIRSGAGTSASPYTLGIAAGGVTSDKLADKSVTFEKFAENSVIKLGDNLAGNMNNTVLGDSIINYITKNFNSTQLGDSISNFVTQNFENLSLGDTILQYITNNLDKSELMDKIVNLLNDNNLYLSSLIKFIAQNVYNTSLGENIVDYVSEHISDTMLGDNILQYIADNILNTVLGDNLINLVHENELDGIVGNEVTDATKEGGLIRSGSGTAVSPYTLGIAAGGVTSDKLADKSVTFEKFAENSVIKLGDNLAGNMNNTVLGDSIINYITKNFNSTQLGDSISNFVTQNFESLALGDTVLQYITNNLDKSELMDKIVELINDNNTYLSSLIENIAQNVYNTSLGENIVNYISNHISDTLLGDNILQYVADNILNTVLGDKIINIVHANELDGVIGNEVTDATKDGGLIRSGAGTSASPYTLGIASGGITSSFISDNAVNTTKISDNAVTSAKIADGTITNADISGLAAIDLSKIALPSASTNSGKVLKSNGTAWVADTDVDSNTTYTAGNGLTLTGTTFSIGTGQINSAMILDGTIVAADLSQMSATTGQVLKWNGTAWTASADSGLTSEVDGVIGNEVTDATANGGLNRSGAGTSASPYTLGVATGGIISSHIADNAVNASKIADNAVTSAKIADGTISNVDISNSAAIDLSKIAFPSASTNSGKVLKSNGTAWVADTDVDTNTTYTAGAGLTLTGTALSIGTGQINSAMILDGTIGAADLSQMNATTGQVLKWNGTTWAASADLGLTTEVDGVIGNEVTDATANGGLIRSGTGTSASPYTLGVATGGITGSHIADNAVTSTKIIDNAVTSAKIADGTITNADISTSAAIALNKLALPDAATNNGKVLKSNGTAWIAGDDNNVDTNTTYTAGAGLTLNGTSFSIGTGQVNNGMIADNAINSAKIADGTITNADISGSAAIDVAKIALPAASSYNGSVLKSNGSTWIASTDNNTTYTAGTGLNLSGTTFSIANGSITANNLSNDAIPVVTKSSYPMKTGTVNATDWFDTTTLNAMFVPGGIYHIRMRINMSASSTTGFNVQINSSHLMTITNPISSSSRVYEFTYVNDTPSTANQTISLLLQTVSGSVTISSGTIDLYRIARI